ncbi:MAG: hypothetical protein ABIP06_14880 [Pyrinomonadaceae bacterium]
MSRFEVNLNELKSESSAKNVTAPSFGTTDAPKKKSRIKKILLILAISLVAIFLLFAVGGFLYYQSLKSTPQYSLALLVDAARRDDQAEIDKLVNVDAVVDDFVPQITDKAVELYGRGLAPSVINKLAVAVTPYLPAVKKRAKAEIPDLIREKTSKFENVPFWAIVLGAGRIMDIRQTSDTASVKSNLQDRPLEVEMKKNGDRWQIVKIKDEVIARRIAEKIGQEMITAAKNGNIENAGKQIGIQNLKDILNNSDIFK